MMHYQKGENVEKEILKEELPFDDCMPNGKKDFLWMRVKGGTKVNNVVTFAKNALDKGEYRTLIWTGAGGGVVKTVSCAEIIKRTHPLYQVTRMDYTEIEEHWLPQMEGLDEIVVKRKIPCLHILMSLDEIDESIHGLQKPNTTTTFFGDPSVLGTKRRQGPRHHQERNSISQQSNQNRNSGRSDQRPANQHQKQKHRKNNEENREKKQNAQGNFQRNKPSKVKQTDDTRNSAELELSANNFSNNAELQQPSPKP